MPKCASDVWAEDRFNNHGIRAVLINGRCLFQGANGGISPCQEYDEEDYALWHALHDYQSRTWKERHAKGVPVKKKNLDDVCAWYNLDAFEGDHQFDSDENPISAVCHIHKAVWRVGATFCNFRYKPEWLEKKAGKNVN